MTIFKFSNQRRLEGVCGLMLLLAGCWNETPAPDPAPWLDTKNTIPESRKLVRADRAPETPEEKAKRLAEKGESDDKTLLREDTADEPVAFGEHKRRSRKEKGGDGTDDGRPPDPPDDAHPGLGNKAAKFMRFDRDGDGELSKEELRGSRIEQYFEQADLNHNGILNKAELVTATGWIKRSDLPEDKDR